MRISAAFTLSATITAEPGDEVVNVASVVSGGSNGTVTDDQIVKIRAAFEGRKEVTKATMRASLNVGDAVWFNEKTRPAYMAGHKAIVRKINRERVVVDLDKPAGRFHRGVTVPLTLLTTTPAN